MATRFYVNQFRELVVESDGEREVLIVARFTQNENKDKCANYLRPIAEQMTTLYNAGKVDGAFALLEEAEARVSDAQSNEKFLQEVSF